MHIASPCRAMRGMTLIEILVVLVIIGILAMLATLSVGILGDDRQIEDETRRLTDAIALLQEQAQLEGRDYGILLETARYEFQRFDAFEQRWKAVEGDAALSAAGTAARPRLRAHPGGPAGPAAARDERRRAPAAARRLGQRRHDALPADARAHAAARASRWSASFDGTHRDRARRCGALTSRGFTLIEVVVALAILGIGMLAVFKTIGDTVNNVDDLRDRSFAEWIADNRITEIRISGEMPSVEETAGEVEFARTAMALADESLADPGPGTAPHRRERAARRGSGEFLASSRFPASSARPRPPRRRRPTTGTRWLKTQVTAATAGEDDDEDEDEDDEDEDDEEGVE